MFSFLSCPSLCYAFEFPLHPRTFHILSPFSYTTSSHDEDLGMKDHQHELRWFLFQSSQDEQLLFSLFPKWSIELSKCCYGYLQVFSIDVYTLSNLCTILSFITPLVAIKFDVLPNVFDEPFPVATPVGDSVIAKRV